MDIEVEVIYPYEPQEEDELRLQVGDIISHVEYLEKGWCKGILNNVSGAFPDNFVRTLSKNKKRMYSPGKSQSPNQPANKTSQTDVSGKRCRVIFSYVPQHEDELALKEGDVLTVMQEVEEGWWKGMLRDRVGMFPSNFVEEIDGGGQNGALGVNIYSLEPTNNEANASLQSSPLREKEERSSKNMHSERRSLGTSDRGTYTKSSKSTATNSVVDKEDKMAFNLDDRKSKKLSATTNFGFPSDSLRSFAISSQISPPLLPPKPVRELAKVMFPYIAEHDDELELHEGEIVTVITKELEDKGWWKGELNGKIGVFPDNFVQIISSSGEEPAKPPRPEKRPSSGKFLTPPDSPLTVSQSPSSSSDANAAPPPPLPGKKVSPLPPQPEKKPSVPPVDGTLTDEASLTIGREDHLQHVTRPKGPSNRRPPSQILKKLSTGDEEESPLPSTNIEEEDASSQDLSSSSAAEATTNGTNDTPAPPSQPPPQEPNHTPPSGEGSKPPWLKELRANQKKKRLSGLFAGTQNETDGQEAQPAPPPPLPTTTAPVSDKTPPTKPRPLLPPTTKPSVPPTKPSLAGSGSPPIPVNREWSRSSNSNHVLPQNRSKPPAPGVTSAPPAVIESHLDQPLGCSVPSPQGNGVVVVNNNSSSTENLNDGKASAGTLLPEEREIDSLLKELLPKMKALEIRLEEQQAHHAIQIQQLTKDLDEERKQRACLQIEVDRLSKLIKGGYTHV